jgi:hypothetical protein
LITAATGRRQRRHGLRVFCEKLPALHSRLSNPTGVVD